MSISEQQYTITKAIVTADRYADTLELDISTLIVELNIYEDVREIFLTGSIVVVDEASIFHKFGFTGSEKIYLEIENGGDVIIKTFIMMEKEISIDDNTVLMFNLVEEHGFLSTTKKYSKSYKGKTEVILSDMIKSQLNKDVIAGYNSESIQDSIRINVPYLTTSKTTKWLLNTISTKDGMPYFLFPSLYSDNLRLISYDTSLSSDPFNKERPYIFGTAVSHSDDKYVNMYAFKGYDLVSKPSEHSLIKSGALSAMLEQVNISTGSSLSVVTNGAALLNQLEENVFNVGEVGNMFDHNFKINDEPVHAITGRVIHTISTEKTFPDYKCISEDKSQAKITSLKNSNTIKKMMEKNTIWVNLSGSFFPIAKAGIGDIVRLFFKRTDISKPVKVESSDFFDDTLSGDYFITNIRHIFKNGIHDVHLAVTKLTRKKDLTI